MRRWLVLALVAAAPLGAQSRVAEVRVDAYAARDAGAEIGGGAVLAAGTYVRLALLAGVGVERASGALTGVQHAEGVARFQLDPFRQARVGVYVGGGLGVRHHAGEPLRPMLVAMVGAEGRPRGGRVLALEAGVGGGARVALAVRGARRDRR